MKASAANTNPTDIYEPPTGDAMVKSNFKIGDAWSLWITTIWQTFTAFLTAYGCMIPQLTTAQRDEIQAPVGGQMIYNMDLNLPQIFVYTNGTVEGEWKTFTVT